MNEIDTLLSLGRDESIPDQETLDRLQIRLRDHIAQRTHAGERAHARPPRRWSLRRRSHALVVTPGIVTVTPNLAAGEAFWSTWLTYSGSRRAANDSTGGGSLYPTAPNPLFGSDDDALANWSTGPGSRVGYVLTAPRSRPSGSATASCARSVPRRCRPGIGRRCSSCP